MSVYKFGDFEVHHNDDFEGDMVVTIPATKTKYINLSIEGTTIRDEGRHAFTIRYDDVRDFVNAVEAGRKFRDEEQAAEDISKFYDGETAPLPDGVVAQSDEETVK